MVSLMLFDINKIITKYVAWIILSGAEMVTLHHLDGIIKSMLQTSFARLKHNRILKIHWVLWHMLEEGIQFYHLFYIYFRVDVKLTQTNDIGLLLNAIN